MSQCSEGCCISEYHLLRITAQYLELCFLSSFCVASLKRRLYPISFWTRGGCGEEEDLGSIKLEQRGKQLVKVTQPSWKLCSVKLHEELIWAVCKGIPYHQRHGMIWWLNPILSPFLENCPLINQKSQVGDLRNHKKTRSSSDKCWAFDRHDWGTF